MSSVALSLILEKVSDKVCSDCLGTECVRRSLLTARPTLALNADLV